MFQLMAMPDISTDSTVDCAMPAPNANASAGATQATAIVKNGLNDLACLALHVQLPGRRTVNLQELAEKKSLYAPAAC